VVVKERLMAGEAEEEHDPLADATVEGREVKVTHSAWDQKTFFSLG